MTSQTAEVPECVKNATENPKRPTNLNPMPKMEKRGTQVAKDVTLRHSLIHHYGNKSTIVRLPVSVSIKRKPSKQPARIPLHERKRLAKLQAMSNKEDSSPPSPEEDIGVGDIGAAIYEAPEENVKDSFFMVTENERGAARNIVQAHRPPRDSFMRTTGRCRDSVLLDMYKPMPPGKRLTRMGSNKNVKGSCRRLSKLREQSSSFRRMKQKMEDEAATIDLMALIPEEQKQKMIDKERAAIEAREQEELRLLREREGTKEERKRKAQQKAYELKLKQLTKDKMEREELLKRRFSKLMIARKELDHLEHEHETSAPSASARNVDSFRKGGGKQESQRFMKVQQSGQPQSYEDVERLESKSQGNSKSPLASNNKEDAIQATGSVSPMLVLPEIAKKRGIDNKSSGSVRNLN